MPNWSGILAQAWDSIGPHIPSIAIALAILVVGWVAALVVRGAVFAALKRTTLDDRLGEALGIQNTDHTIERAIARGVYYLALAFVAVAFLERLHVTAVTAPIVNALEGLSSAVPSVLKAVLIGLAGLVAASVLRKLVVAGLDRTGAVDRLEAWSGLEPSAPPPGKAKKAKGKGEPEAPPRLSERLGSLVFWVILILTAIPVLDALRIGALAAPLTSALEVVSTYLPRVAGAALLAAFGYFLGRGARAVVRGVFDRSGVDRALGRVGLRGALGEHSVGSVAGTVVMAFIVLQFAISAVGRLGIQEISGPLGQVLEQIYAFLPRLLVASLLLAVGVALARVLSRFARGVLAAIGFNALMVHIGLHEEMSSEERAQQEKSKALLDERLAHAASTEDDSAEGDAGEVDPLVAESERLRTPADLGGVIVGAVVVVLFVRQSLEVLGLTGMATMFDSLIGYLPRVAVAVVVLGAGMWAGGFAHGKLRDFVGSSKDTLVLALPTLVRGVVVAIAAMVALQQLGIGNQIIAIAFGLLLGAVCLAFALAFGLGGRDVAAKFLAREYDKRAGK